MIRDKTQLSKNYKHLKRTINELTNDFMLLLLEKLSLGKKEIMLMEDFDINLLLSDVDKETSNFKDNIHSNSFFPTVNLPTRITA